MALDGIFFPGHNCPSAGMGAFGAAALSDGIVAGCTMSHSNDAITIATGYVIAGGRLIKVDSSDTAEAVAVPPGTTEGYVVLTIDLSEGSPEITLSFSASQPAASDPDDINVNGQSSYTTWIARYDSSYATPVVPRMAGSGSGSGGSGLGDLTVLWTNENSYWSDGDAVELTNGALTTYPWIYILYQRYPSASSAAGKSVYGEMYYIPTDDAAYNNLLSNYIQHNNTSGLYFTASMIIPSDATSSNNYTRIYTRALSFHKEQDHDYVRFGKGRVFCAGYTPTVGANYMVPKIIYGLGG